MEESYDWVWILEDFSSHDGEEGWETGKEGSPTFSADPVALPIVILAPVGQGLPNWGNDRCQWIAPLTL